MTAQRCYTGLETREDELWLNPSLPEELDGLNFDVRYRGHWGINLHLTPSSCGSRWPTSTPHHQGRRQGEVVEIAPGGMREFFL